MGKSLFLKDLSALSKIDTINGLTIAQIEQRAKKITDNTTDSDWRYRSFDGFLGEQETFGERLAIDWQLVENMGTSHLILAGCLREIISGVEHVRQTKLYGPMTTIRISYQHPKEGYKGFIQEINGSTQAVSESDVMHVPQTLTISRQTFSGYQFSLFFNPSSPPLPDLNTKWNDEYTIRNDSAGYEIKVTSGILQYIEWFGFYEGGDDNPYRIDPVILRAILTGDQQQPYLTLLENTKKQLAVAKLQEDIKIAKERQGQEGITEEERSWLETEVKQLLVKLGELQ